MAEIQDRERLNRDSPRERTRAAGLNWEQVTATIALQIRQSLDAPTILQTTVDQVQQLLACDRALLYQFSPDQSGQVVVEALSDPQWSLIDRVMRDACFDAQWLEPYAENQSRAIADVAAANLSPCYTEFLARLQVKAYLVVPVLCQSRLWGLLIVHSCTAPRWWQAEEIAGLQQIAVHVGIALCQADLVAQLQAAKADLETQVVARTHELEQANRQLALEIEERNRVAAALQQREGFLRQVLDSLFTFVGVVTPAGILIEANQAPLEIAGITREDVIGRPFDEAYWWRHSPEAQAQIRAAMAQANQGQLVRFDIEAQAQGGSCVTIDFCLNPLRDANGQITHLIPSGIDITKRKQAELALRQSRDERFQLAAIVESSQDAIIGKTSEGIITSWNRAAEHLFGYTAQEAIGQPITLIIPPERQADAALIFQHLHQGKCIETYETQRQCKDGHLVDVALTISPVLDETGVLIGASKIARDITAQRQAQRAMQEQTAILHSFYNSSPLMMGVVELSENDILHVSDNQATATFFNTTVEALEGQWASDLGVPPDHRQTWIGHYHQSQVSGQPVQFDYAHITDNQTTWLSVVVSYIGLSNSQRPRFSYVASDISDRKQTEADLRASEARWQFALEGAGDGVWDWNPQTNDLVLSRQWKAMLGYGEDEVGTTLEEWSGRVHPDDIAQCYADLNRHFNGETPIYRDEYRIRCKDGSYKWVLDRGKVIEWTETGEPLRVIGTLSDISDRKQMELTLKAKNQELDQFFSIALDLLCIADTDGYFHRLNQQWQQTLGYSLATLEGSRFLDYVHPDDLPATIEELSNLANQKSIYQFTNRYRCQDGSYRWIEWRSAPVGNLIYAAARDITVRRQVELDLQQAKEQLDLVLQASSEGFSDWNMLTKEIYFSPRFKEILGYADHEFENSLDMWESVIFEEDKQDSWQLVEDYNNGIIDHFSITQRYRHKNGSTIYILTRVIHLKDAAGQVVRMVGSHLDITAMVTMQKALQTSEMQLSSVLDSSLDGIMAFRSVRDQQGTIVDFEWLLSNPTACEFVGRIESDLVGKRLLEEMPGNREEGLFDGYVHTVETGKPYQHEFYYNHDGIESWFENVAVKLGDGFAVTFRNVTTIKQSERALHQANQQLESRLTELDQRHTEMVILSEISDFFQACSTVEEACYTITNLVETLFPNCAGGIFLTRESRNRLEQVSTWGTSLMNSKADFEPHHCWGLRRGRMHYVGPDRLSLRCHHIPDHGELAATLCIPMMAQGETLGLLYLSTQTPEALTKPKQQLARTLAEQTGLAIANLKLQESLKHQSIRDPLTGLYNRRYLEESLTQEIMRAQRKRHAIGVIMLDIDHFKQFNDTFGHDTGDLVLQLVGTLLKEHVRNSDIACRYGGEEMVLILPEANLAETTARAETIRVAINQLQTDHTGQRLEVLTASFGVACFPQHGSTVPALVTAADTALYQAKAAGRNQVVMA